MRHIATGLVGGFFTGLVFGAVAATVSTTGQLSITVFNPPIVSFNPANPQVVCNAAPGTQVAAVTVSGGDGKAITQTLSGDTTDFALTGGNVVVGTNGIAASSCPVPPALTAPQSVTVTATQP